MIESTSTPSLDLGPLEDLLAPAQEMGVQTVACEMSLEVMAAAFTWGTESGDMGTLVKLTRVVLLAPALVVLGLLSGGGTRMRYSWKEPPIPWFVIGFLAVGVVGSIGVLPPEAKAWLSNATSS